MPDAADRLGEMPADILSFWEFLNYLRDRGFTHIDGEPISEMLKAVKSAPALEDWLPAISYWRPIGRGENWVRLCLMSPHGFLAKTDIERRTESDRDGRNSARRDGPAWLSRWGES